MLVYFKIGFSRTILNACFVWLGFSFVLLIAHGTFTPFFIFRHLAFLLTTYVIVMLFKEKLFLKFERIIFYFAFISLGFYLWQHIHLGSLLSIGKTLDISGYSSSFGFQYYNIIFYTIRPAQDVIFQRNFGFCWEPGPFSICLVIALYLNLARTNFKIKGNKTLLILLIALATTQSTTGILVFGLLVCYLIYFEMKSKSKYIIIPIAVGIFLYAFLVLPFMYEKIDMLYEQGTKIDETSMVLARKTKSNYSSGRVGGFILGWRDFKRFPLWGIGGNSILSSGNVGAGKVYIVNGLASIMSVYGLFGLLMYFRFSMKTSKIIANYFKLKGKYAFFIIIILISFGFAPYVQIMLFTLIFLSIFIKKSNSKTENNVRSLKKIKAKTYNENPFLH